MKRKLTPVALLLVLLLLLTGFSGQADSVLLAKNLSANAKVQLFSPYGSTDIFAYTDGQTHILKTDGTAAVTTAYPAEFVFLRGNTLSAVSPMEGFTVAERFDAATLTRTDLIGLDLTATDLLVLETDRFGHFFAVQNSEPDTLILFDAAGSRVGTIACPVNILDIQVLEDKLYLFLPEKCLTLALTDTLPQNYTTAFTYTGTAVPFRMCSPSTYISTNGTVYGTAGTALTTAGHYALRETALTAANGYLYWAGEDSDVLRYSLSEKAAAFFTLPGTAEALSGTAAVVRTDDEYRLVTYGTFTPVATPTPVPTATPSPSPTPTPTPKPTKKPASTPTAVPTAKPTVTPTAKPTAKPTATPTQKPTQKPAASPTVKPTPTPIPGVTAENGYLYVPVGTTAAALRSTLPYEDVEICTSTMTAATGKARTGWTVVTADAQYTVIVPGDINSSGTVNSVDIRLLQQFLLGTQTPTQAQQLAGDLNRNETPDAADLVLLARLIQ